MTKQEIISYSRHYFGGLDPPDYYIDVPCGYCKSCGVARMRSYMIRLLYECNNYPDSVFITLTFNNDSLSVFRDNPNRAVRLFLDRCRKFFNTSVRHWFVPEYGTLHGRIHYHGILFNTGLDFNPNNLAALWRYGFIYIGYANERTCRYICKYVTKSYSRGYSSPPRIISSKGIGKNFLNSENIAFHRSDGILRPYIIYGSLKVPLPRYYYDKIFDSEDKYQMLLDRWMNPNDTWYCNGRSYSDYNSFLNARKDLFNRNLALGLSTIKPKKQLNYAISNSKELQKEGSTL